MNIDNTIKQYEKYIDQYYAKFLKPKKPTKTKKNKIGKPEPIRVK